MSAEIPQLNPQAVSAASIATGLATVMEYIPPLAGAVSSILGVFLTWYLINHKRQQIEIDRETIRKLKAETEKIELETSIMREGKDE